MIAADALGEKDNLRNYIHITNVVYLRISAKNHKIDTEKNTAQS